VKWPWRRAEEKQERHAKAEGQVEEARSELERTVKRGERVTSVLEMLRYHAEKNEIVENIQKVARGVG
jgi:transcriptional regulator